MKLTHVVIALLILSMTIVSTGCVSRVTTRGEYGEKDKWIMPQSEDDMPLWGIKGGIVVGIYPSRMSFGNTFGGPRGLLRIGFEEDGQLHFVNYMAITPLTKGTGNRLVHNGSELSRSPDDGNKGIQFFAYPVDYLDHPGRYDKIPAHHNAAEIKSRSGSKVLTWGVKTERYPVGTEVFVILTIDEDRPYEFEVEMHVVRKASITKKLMMSSTFGNITRLRDLYVDGKVVNAKNLYKGFSGNGFADWEYWGHRKLRKDSRGDLLFIARPDENNPWNTPPYPHDYRLLQYYRKKKGSWSSDLKGGVNGRTRMWGTGKAIPGGVSYENLAILENFDQGQTFSYGIYNGSVKDLLDRKKPPRF